jgi:hypothetical protein
MEWEGEVEVDEGKMRRQRPQSSGAVSKSACLATTDIQLHLWNWGLLLALAG